MKTYSFMLAIACALLCACGQSTSTETTTDSTSTTVADINSVEQDDLQTLSKNNVTDSPRNFQASTTITPNTPPPNFDWNKKLIKTANAQVECKDYKIYNQQVHSLARQHGAWIASESESQQQDRINNTLTIKVPVPQFEDLVMAISNLDGKMIEKTISTEDVTSQIVDTKGRIAVRKEMRDKYLDLLHDTKKIDDALKVQRELNDMHEDIEVAANHLQSMQVQAAYSTINLHYFQTLSVVEEPVVDNTPGFGSRILDAASSGATWLTDVAVGLMNIWPIIIIVGGGVWYYRRKWKVNSKPSA